MATFRVLCLHGFGQDAPKFRNRISSLRRALKSSFDFVFPQAPFLMTSYPNSTPEEQAKIAEAEPTYKWWDFEIDEETGKHTYGRVDEAVDYLAEFVKREGPFDGIFGFSQGGMMASLLLQRQFADPNNSPFKFKFAIFVASCDLGDPEYKSEQKVDVPSIHIMGETDAIVTMDRSQKLLELYNSPKVFVHPGGHYIPTSKEPKDALREFAKEMTAVYGAK
ncbi:Serine hydrolase (FSH1) [Phytophthora cinnamomi]|uniref:Serine hydrolase (FSH1) n=1 Tax=Phytophthora cinnamomi TaxID=4785 RepID=UPI00355A64D3|nr:Serine hydrolase (FSH1) [Phytophthora cinnamomi]